MAARRQQEVSENGYAVRPPFGMRFPTREAQMIIREVFREHLATNPDYDTELGKKIADDIRARLKALELRRYKYMVQVFVGENKGEGVRIGSKCLWDAATDDMATESTTSDKLFVSAVAYGVYLY